VLAFALALVAGDMPAEEGEAVRLVRSSAAQGDRVLMLSTVSLYANNDAWKSYLASEKVYPGGEPTDLPPARQIVTVACLVNFARERRGLRSLSVRSTLELASAEKAKETFRCANFAHNPCGGDWRDAVWSTGYVGVVGESLYLASGRWGAPRVAVDAWLNSPLHRQNLFGTKWRDQGLTVPPKENFGSYRGVVLWVSVFGG
jgi:hypothetical protein